MNILFKSNAVSSYHRGRSGQEKDICTESQGLGHDSVEILVLGEDFVVDIANELSLDLLVQLLLYVRVLTEIVEGLRQCIGNGLDSYEESHELIKNNFRTVKN